MNPQTLKLYELLGEGRTKFEPDGGGYDFNEVPDEPTIADLHRWMNENGYFTQSKFVFGYFLPRVNSTGSFVKGSFPYNSSLPLLNQPTETLDAIIELIDNHK
jgi:hypothetical protein